MSRPLINGGLMQSYVGQNATLLGKFESLEANGKLMKVKLTDGNVIVALVNTPLSGPVAAGSYVWLEGKVENRNKFNPTAIRVFPPDMCETFDDSLWNEMIGCMVEHPEMMYDFSDTGIHYGVDEVAPDGSNADIIPFPDHDQADQQAADAKAAGEDQFDESFDKAFG